MALIYLTAFSRLHFFCWKYSGKYKHRNRCARKIKNRPAGLKRLKQEDDPYMLYDARLAHFSWSQVTEENIARCWIKSMVLAEGES